MATVDEHLHKQNQHPRAEWREARGTSASVCANGERGDP
ncbi:uncharacterized protein HHUB_3420 [Halobacterium hubeiense]|uniref:Uncharacterized protein n=1 Tax=Halobacterium hubeiense TaxID=1407499 RepID=A0A0U5H349_9EURY|nr:uncharacterized protein HHUB_3420 [Halobacterium hubeiense]